MYKDDGNEIESRLKDIERSKQERLSRDHDRRQRVEESERRSLQQAGALAVEDWDTFDMKQTIQRAEIRVKEGRGSPMDIWYHNLDEESPVVADCLNPSKTLKKFSAKDLEEAINEVSVWLRVPSQKEFWTSMLELMKIELVDAREQKANIGRLHEAVSSEVQELLGGKTHKELLELEEEINQTLGSGAGIDVDYWEMLLRHLTTFKHRAKVQEMYTRAVNAKLAKLSAAEQHYMRQHIEGIEIALATANHSGLNLDKKKRPAAASGDAPADGLTADAKAQIEKLQKESELLKAKSLSLVEPTEVMAGRDSLRSAKQMFDQESKRPMREGEMAFNKPIPLPPPPPGRVKPMYFNRVKMGYDWNRYNQTHYDRDNPPPKVVKSYRFNIFYPDLKDKTKAPTWYLQPENSDNQIIVFKAGEPYADIAFRIVNREWEKAQNYGYRSSFERGVLHLWFHLKRFRYRR